MSLRHTLVRSDSPKVEIQEELREDPQGELWIEGKRYSKVAVMGDHRALPPGRYRVVDGRLYRVLETHERWPPNEPVAYASTVCPHPKTHGR